MPCPSGTPTDTSWPWGLNLCPHPPLLLLPGERRGAGERLGRPAPLRGHSDPKRNGAFFPRREVCEPFPLRGWPEGDGSRAVQRRGLEAHGSRPHGWVRWKRYGVFCHVTSSRLVWGRSCPCHPGSPSVGRPVPRDAAPRSCFIPSDRGEARPIPSAAPLSPLALEAACRGERGGGAGLGVAPSLYRSVPHHSGIATSALVSQNQLGAPVPASPAAPSLF